MLLNIRNESRITYIYFFCFFKKGKLLYSQYETLAANKSFVLNSPNNAEKMYTIAKSNSLVFPSPFILMNICNIPQNSQDTNISMRPDEISVAKNITNLIGQNVTLLNCYGDISQFVNNTTNLGVNVINLKREDIVCTYIGIQLDLISINKMIEYFSYVNVNINENKYAPLAYFFIIVFFIILVIVVVIIFVAAISLTNQHSKKEKGKINSNNKIGVNN